MTYIPTTLTNSNKHATKIKFTSMVQSIQIHIYGTKHTFAKQCIKYSLPNSINNTSQSVKDKLHTHSLQGFINYAKYRIIQNYKNTCTLITLL